MKRIELVFRQRPIAQSELDRDIVKPAGPKTAIEMPQPRNDHAHDRRLDVGTCLIEDEEIEARALGETHTGLHLLAGVELTEIGVETGPHNRSAARRQIGMVAQSEYRAAVMARLLTRFPDLRVRTPAAHETDGQELIELGHCA